MGTLFSYLKWRGDLSFIEFPFNEVDNIIFCAFSYIKLEDLWKEERITIKELYPKYKESLKKESFLLKNQEKLFYLLAHSIRFQNVIITQFVKETSIELEKQFCAMTFILSDKELFIAFRGTDETLTGWKENFNLSYQETASQKRAVSYIEEIAKHTKKEITIGGHSKGGNLAMYGYINSKDTIRKKIKKIYNNDGPGLNFKIKANNELKEMEKNVITFIPKASIVGGFFDNHSVIKIIESNSVGILEHDLYTWKIDGNSIVTAKNMDKKTKEICNYINEKLKEMSEEKKRKIINFIYELLSSFGINDIEEVLFKLGKNNFLLKKYNLSMEDMQLVWKLLPLILEMIERFS